MYLSNFILEGLKKVGLKSIDEQFSTTDIITWFEQQYSLYSEIQIDKTMEPKFCYEINFYHEGEYKDVTKREHMFLYYTRIEAELGCINRLITIVNNQEI